MRHPSFLACLGVAIAAACTNLDDPPPQIDVDPGPMVVGHDPIAQWPCDVYTDSVDAELALILSGDSTLEREVHDCQRLIVNHEYGPLVGVFPYSPSMTLPDASFRDWTRVATVYNWGWADRRAVPYEPLGLVGGLHCLFLRKDASGWHASLVQYTRGCIPGRGFAPLVVEAQQYSGRRPAGLPAYPATARFRWHPREQQYSIGLKCGENWCTVRHQSAATALPRLQGPLLRTVPGYFDEQPLAVYDSVNDTLLVGPIGRIYPNEALRNANAPGTHPRVWNVLAEYAEFEVERGTDAALFNAYVDKLGLAVDPSGAMARAALAVRVGEAGLYAETRVGGVRSKPAELVELVENRHHSAEGTVRWRWMERDEAAWVPCQVDNCCTAAWKL